MVIFDILFFVMVCLVVIGFVTQVIIPALDGTPYFPWLRKNEVQKEIIATEQALEVTSQEEHLKVLKDELDQRKAKLKG